MFISIHQAVEGIQIIFDGIKPADLSGNVHVDIPSTHSAEIIEHSTGAISLMLRSKTTVVGIIKSE